jgi:hypothetical protein
MLQLVLVAVLAAALVGLSTVAGRRWGHEAAGLVGAFPLIVGLTMASDRFGPAVAGILAALPTLASVLAVFTHARFGGGALVSMLRGMLGGLAAFVIFCALIAQLIEPTGVAVAFLLATVASMLAQLAAVRLVSGA